MKKLVLYSVLLVVLLAGIAYAQPYYADMSFFVKDDGSVQLSGLSNHPAFSQTISQDFTSKRGKYWILNITVPGNFSNAVYTISLPQNAAINYLGSTMTSRIVSESSRPAVKGSGENTSFSVVIQYSMDNGNSAVGLSAYVIAGGLALLLVIVLLFYRRFVLHAHSRKAAGHPHHTSSPTGAEAHGHAEKWYDKELLPDRQKDIIEKLEEHGKPVTQRSLESEFSIPKSSLSRNIDSLVRRGIIKKERKGMVNVLILNPKKPEI